YTDCLNRRVLWVYLCPARSTGGGHWFPPKIRHRRRKIRVHRIHTSRRFNPNNLGIPPFATVIRQGWYWNQEIVNHDATDFETSQCLLASISSGRLLWTRYRDNQSKQHD